MDRIVSALVAIGAAAFSLAAWKMGVPSPAPETGAILAAIAALNAIA